jgi:transposase
VTTPETFPDEIAALRAALTAERERRIAEEVRAARVEAELAVAKAKASEDEALIAHQRLQIAKLTRQLYGQRSERTVRLVDQMELAFEELESSASEDEITAERAVAKTTNVAAFTRKRPARQPFPEHLPRERVVEPGPAACLCCGSPRLRKLGESLPSGLTRGTSPRRWRAFRGSGRACPREGGGDPARPREIHLPGLREDQSGAGTISCDRPRLGRPEPLGDDPVREVRAASALEPPGRTLHQGGGAPQPVDPRPAPGQALADQVGACCAVLAPLLRRLEGHVFAAERLHGDDTTVPVLAKGKTDIGRCWVYVRDDRPFGGQGPPAAMFYYSRDRRGEHPQGHLAGYAGILQADAFGGYGKLYEPERKPGPIVEAGCWSHARRPFFILADLAANARRRAQGKTASVISPLALEAVRRIDALFEIERAINGHSAEQRRAARQELSAPLIADLERWLREQRARLSRGNDLAKAMDYLLKRWPAFTRFLDDGRICLTNNAAERGLRGIALGRRSWLFAGSDRGGQRAAAMYSLIVTAKMNDVDPQAWLADVLARIAEHPAHKIDDLLPWNWRSPSASCSQAA